MPHRFDAVSPEQRPPAPPVERRAAGDVDPRLLEILVCPLTKTTLEWDAEKQELISRAARLAFPVRDGVPIMLAREARALEG
jgi:uncharacterized protein YbaR (Trm112 family)